MSGANDLQCCCFVNESVQTNTHLYIWQDKKLYLTHYSLWCCLAKNTYIQDILITRFFLFPNSHSSVSTSFAKLTVVIMGNHGWFFGCCYMQPIYVFFNTLLCSLWVYWAVGCINALLTYITISILQTIMSKRQCQKCNFIVF